jgi:hypothetical protein
MLETAFSQIIALSNIINLIIGGCVSALVSWWFFRKSKPLEELTKEIHESLSEQKKLTQWLSGHLGRQYIKDVLPQFSNSKFFLGPNAQPTTQDLDQPYLQFVCITRSLPSKVQILCRVVDQCWNFNSTNGLKIEYQNKFYHPDALLYGYMLLDIPLQELSNNQSVLFKFHLVDSIGNLNTQDVPVKGI